MERGNLMKKKILALLMAITVCLSGTFYQDVETRAEDIGEDIDFSYLQTDSALIGYAEMQTWGVYLTSGYSIINKISSTKIGVGGVTNAAVKCKVQVVPVVERLSNGTWNYVTSWTVTTASGYSAMASKSITVGTGYCYRVRCTHSASTDVSVSWTDGLWM